jgi:hypothetical protein
VDDPTTTLTMPAANQTITATYNAAATYTLTVNSGSGDGSYAASTVVDIDANAAASGYTFDDWIGNTSGIANVNASSTTLTMPAANQTITATYEAVQAGTPSVSGVSGTVDQWDTITISGSNFGSSPNVVLFDDFELGTDGEDIMLGSGSARYGEWHSKDAQSAVYYCDDSAVSGSLSFRADMSVNHPNYIEALLPANTRDFFMSWWMYVPAGEKIPGEDTQDTTNWKTVWILGSSTTDDDITLPTILDGGAMLITANGSPYTKWMSIDLVKGEWKRVWVWTKGGYSSDGQCHYWELDDPNGVVQRVNDNNVTLMNSGGIRERLHVNGYGRTTPNCHTGFDDVYLAVGSNARARVEIGNASSYNNCTGLAVCVPTNWGSSSITAKCNVGGLDPQDDWYLFVVDADGDVSSGYSLN